MTVQQLSHLHDLNALIEYHKRRLADLRRRTQPGAQSMTGMPRAPGAKDKIGELVPRIVDLERRVQAEIAEYEREKAEITDYIGGIKDARARVIFLLRFVDRLTWKEISAALGNSVTPDSVRKTVYRYLRKGA
jgi:DNA-directed RNA polymerase specialized sigma24 family protein